MVRVKNERQGLEILYFNPHCIGCLMTDAESACKNERLGLGGARAHTANTTAERHSPSCRSTTSTTSVSFSLEYHQFKPPKISSKTAASILGMPISAVSASTADQQKTSSYCRL